MPSGRRPPPKSKKKWLVCIKRRKYCRIKPLGGAGLGLGGGMPKTVPPAGSKFFGVFFQVTKFLTKKRRKGARAKNIANTVKK